MNNITFKQSVIQQLTEHSTRLNFISSMLDEMRVSQTNHLHHHEEISKAWSNRNWQMILIVISAIISATVSSTISFFR